jgi:phage tail-like protein
MKHSEIAYLLPSIFQRTLGPESPMDAMLCAMEALHSRPEEILDQLDSIFASHRAPEAFVPFLARWVDLERIFAPREEADNVISTGLGRLRELIRGAAYFSKWRGTKEGLQRFLETATGVTGFLIEEPAAQPFHLRITAPKEVEVHRALIERIVNVERPAYATWEVQFQGEPVAGS